MDTGFIKEFFEKGRNMQKEEMFVKLLKLNFTLILQRGNSSAYYLKLTDMPGTGS